MIIIDELSFAFVEKEGLRRISESCNLGLTSLTYWYYEGLVQIYMEERKKLTSIQRSQFHVCVLPSICGLQSKIFTTCASLYISLIKFGS